MLLQDAVDDFVVSLMNGEVDRSGGSRNTMMAYRNDLGQLCSYMRALGITDWLHVTHDQLDDYIREMREGRVYRPTTIARKLAAVKSFFRYMYQKKILLCDPAVGLALPSFERELPQVLSPEAIYDLFRRIEVDTPIGIRDLAMIKLLYATGIRTSELVSLDTDHFQAANANLQCVSMRGNVRRERSLPLTSVAVDAMDNYMLHGRPHLMRYVGEQALFLNHHGERLTRQGFWLIIKGYAHRAGIDDLTPHRLRHSFAILMLNSGMDLGSVQELLGHAHISTTQLYCQLLEAEQT
jgi:integrase/recombinase XerD